MVRVLVIPADNDKPVTLVDTDGSLDQFQSLVGGYIEVVTLFKLGNHSLYLNEEGKLNGLPSNDRASLLFYKGGGSTMDVIVGGKTLREAIRKGKSDA